MKMSKSLGNTTAPAGRHPAVRRRHPAPLGRADRLFRRPAHRPGDPQGHRRQLPPPAQHAALPARRPRRLRRGRARRAGGDARARALGAAPADRARRGGLEGLRGLRLPARVPDAVPVRHRRPLGLLLRRPQGRALLRRGDQPAPPRRPHRARRPLPPPRHLARADAPLHHGGGLARPLPRRGQLGPPRRLPRDPARLARRRPRGEVGRHPPRPPRRHRRARDRAPRQAHRRQPRGRTDRPRRRRAPCAPRSPRSTSPTSASPRT